MLPASTFRPSRRMGRGGAMSEGPTLRVPAGASKARTSSSKQTGGTSRQQPDVQLATTTTSKPRPTSKASQFYAFITGFPFPLGPLFQRKTCRYEVRPLAMPPCIRQLSLIKRGATHGASMLASTILPPLQTAAAGTCHHSPLGEPHASTTLLPLWLLQAVKDTIWTFEQTQALENFCVYTPVRMTVIRLKTGGLWVHAPIAPTQECVQMVK